jgi:hypothetical protein
LTCVAFSPSQNVLLPADLATISNAIRRDNVVQQHTPGAFTREGNLFIPDRGVVALRPGDVVAYDAQGWPVLISAYSIATGGWTFT